MAYLMGSFPQSYLDQFGAAGFGGDPYASLQEAMRPPEGGPEALYERLFELFAPQFSSPSEEWKKQNFRDSILAAGAAMLSGEDLMEGLGRAGMAFSQTRYDRGQDEQQKLDLRAREDALSRYRAASASGIGDQEPDYELAKDPALLRWKEQQRWLLENKPKEEPAVYNPETDIPTQRRKYYEEQGWGDANSSAPTMRTNPAWTYNENTREWSPPVGEGGEDIPKVSFKEFAQELASDPKTRKNYFDMFVFPTLSKEEQEDYKLIGAGSDAPIEDNTPWYIRRFVAQQLGMNPASISYQDAINWFADYVYKSVGAPPQFSDIQLANELPD